MLASCRHRRRPLGLRAARAQCLWQSRPRGHRCLMPRAGRTLLENSHALRRATSPRKRLASPEHNSDWHLGSEFAARQRTRQSDWLRPSVPHQPDLPRPLALHTAPLRDDIPNGTPYTLTSIRCNGRWRPFSEIMRPFAAAGIPMPRCSHPRRPAHGCRPTRQCCLPEPPSPVASRVRRRSVGDRVFGCSFDGYHRVIQPIVTQAHVALDAGVTQ